MQTPPLAQDIERFTDRYITIRLTADGFVYTYPSSEDYHIETLEDRSQSPILDGHLKGHKKQFVSIEWSRLSSVWSKSIEQHPILCDPMGIVRILYPASHYVVIPSGMSDDKDVHWWRLTAPVFASDDHYYTETYTLGDGKPSFAVGYDISVKGFLQRSFVSCQFVPTVIPFVAYLLRQSSLHTDLTLGVELIEDGCDLVLCQSGDLLRANHYSWVRYRSWEHHLYQVLYFLSKVYLDRSVDHNLPVSIILSDGTAGANEIVCQLLEELHRQFAVIRWRVTTTPADYWYCH